MLYYQATDRYMLYIHVRNIGEVSGKILEKLRLKCSPEGKKTNGLNPFVSYTLTEMLSFKNYNNNKKCRRQLNLEQCEIINVAERQVWCTDGKYIFRLFSVFFLEWGLGEVMKINLWEMKDVLRGFLNCCSNQAPV